MCDGYSPAFVEGLAAPPARSASPADVVPHKPIVAYH